MGITQSEHSQSALSIKVSTWDRQSRQLFDYHDQKDHSSTTFLASREGYLVRTADCFQYKKLLSAEEAPLMQLTQVGSCVNVGCPQSKQENSQKLLWVVAQPGMQFELKVGDMIRLGHLDVKVCQINLEHRDHPSETTANLLNDTLIEAEQTKSVSSCRSGMPSCRICFSRETTQDNPLIAPCRCSGSLKYIHIACLRDWVTRKAQKRSSPQCSYYCWKKGQCEVCSYQFRGQYIQGNISYELWRFPRPPEPHLILEYRKKHGEEEKNYLCVGKLEQGRQLRIGRDQSSDIKLGDISVSRNHCSLWLRNRSLYIQDNKSKFGTLLRFKERRYLSLGELWLQSGSTMARISEDNRLCNMCCGGCLNELQFTVEGESL